MVKMRPRRFQRGKGDFLKKRLIFFAVMAALLCFAVPAVASPPGTAPMFEAMSFDMSNTLGVYTQEAAIVTAPASSEPDLAYGYIALGLALVITVIAMLAYLMRGNASQVMRERNGRGIANGREERRRWV